MSFDANALMPTLQPEAATSETLPSEKESVEPVEGCRDETEEEDANSGTPPAPERSLRQGRTSNVVSRANKAADAAQALETELGRCRSLGSNIAGSAVTLAIAITSVTRLARKDPKAFKTTIEKLCGAKNLKGAGSSKKRSARPELEVVIYVFPDDPALHTHGVDRKSPPIKAKLQAIRTQRSTYAAAVGHLLTLPEGTALEAYILESGGLSGRAKLFRPITSQPTTPPWWKSLSERCSPGEEVQLRGRLRKASDGKVTWIDETARSEGD